MTSRVDQALATSGILYAHLVENPSMGVSRGLYWNLQVEFEIDGQGPAASECSLSVDWLTLDVARFEQISGCALPSSREHRSIEASFYLDRLHNIELRSLRFRQASSSVAELEVSGALAGYLAGEKRNRGRITASCNVRFSGVVVVPENVFPKPSSTAAARAMITPFFDVTTLDRGSCTDFRYVFLPA